VRRRLGLEDLGESPLVGRPLAPVVEFGDLLDRQPKALEAAPRETSSRSAQW
jgi:hypothetical protein